MRGVNWFWNTAEGKNTSSWISEGVTRTMLFEEDLEGPLGIITKMHWVE